MSNTDARTITVEVRRQWNDPYKIAHYRLEDVWDLHWDWLSGGVCAPCPRPFIHGYVMCDAMIDRDSCPHMSPRPATSPNQSLPHKKG